MMISAISDLLYFCEKIGSSLYGFFEKAKGKRVSFEAGFLRKQFRTSIVSRIANVKVGCDVENYSYNQVHHA